MASGVHYLVQYLDIANLLLIMQGCKGVLMTDHNHDKHKDHSPKPGPFQKLSDFVLNVFDKKYMLLLWIPIILFVISVGIIVHHYASTGDFIYRDVTLKGGATIKINNFAGHSSEEIELFLESKFGKDKTSVRELSELGKQTGIIIDSSDIAPEDIKSVMVKEYGVTPNTMEINMIGASLGASFFQETLKALAVAFLFMACVVFLYFGNNFVYKVVSVILSFVATFLVFYGRSVFAFVIAGIIFAVILYLCIKDSIPSVAIILAAFCDIVCTWAVTILFGIHIGIVGIAAFLMLIGYSVDTDILLTTRVLRRKDQSIFEATMGAMKTGLTMSFAAIAAVLVAYFFTASPTIKQIMIILFIGLLFDIVNTWLQNAAILRHYLEKKKEKHHHSDEEQDS